MANNQLLTKPTIMVSKIFIVLLVIVAVSTTQRKADFTLCPNQSDAWVWIAKEINFACECIYYRKKLVGNVTVDYPKKFLTVQVQYVRLPKTGMYDKLIKCIEVSDTFV